MRELEKAWARFLLLLGLPLPCLLVPLDAWSDPPPAPATDVQIRPLSSYYPQFALNRGVGGVAVIDCERDDKGDVLCAVAVDDPPGFGFARAASDFLHDNPHGEPLSDLQASEGLRGLVFRFTSKDGRVAIERATAPPPSPQTALHPMEARTTIISEPKGPAPLTANDLAQVYPAAAAQQHIDGRVVLACTIDAQGVATGCEVASESPQGYGFGAAALALAPKLVFAPGTRDGKPISLPIRIPISFSAPRILDLGAFTMPYIGDPMAHFYPNRARASRISGRATMECKVTAAAMLTNCRVISEEPSGYGFGDATLKISSYFTLKPDTVRRLNGMPYVFTMRWQPS